MISLAARPGAAVHDDQEDPKSRITDVALAPDALLPGSGSGFDLWREDEDRRRVKTIVGAFAERPKLPKMLRRKDLFDTVSNGCEQGLYVLSLPRPDGSARTWWRAQIDESGADRRCTRSGAEFCRSTGRTCPSPFDAWEAGWTDRKKRCEGRRSCFLLRWVRSDHRPSRGRLDRRAGDLTMPRSQGAGSSCRRRQVGPCVVDKRYGINLGETPPAGIVSKTAVLRIPPQPIDVSSMTPEALPDAWSGNKATAHSIEQALASERGVASLPWKLVETAITAAMNSGFLRQIPGGVSWPCQPHEAAAIEFGVPEATGPRGDARN